jgi:deoxyribonuclease V
MLGAEEQLIKTQRELQSNVLYSDHFTAPLKTVAGVDVEYHKTSDIITGGVVILDYQSKKLIEVATHSMKATFPYIPGLFSFREMPPIVEAFKKLNHKPDIIICDGQGVAHPRRFGLACHLGVTLDIQTIGCGKTRLYGTYDQPASKRGSTSILFAEDNHEEIGKVLRTQDGVNPLFISIGHKISIDTACRIVLEMTTKYRLPETTRLADQYAREASDLFQKQLDA